MCGWLLCRLFVCSCLALSSFRVACNVLQLPEGGDFEAIHCQPSTNFDRSTKLDLTTEPPLACRCCYAFALLFLSYGLLSFRVCFWCVGLVALLQNLALAWACAVLQMCHQMHWLFNYKGYYYTNYYYSNRQKQKCFQ